MSYHAILEYFRELSHFYFDAKKTKKVRFWTMLSESPEGTANRLSAICDGHAPSQGVPAPKEGPKPFTPEMPFFPMSNSFGNPWSGYPPEE